jgi:hypothetical protein
MFENLAAKKYFSLFKKRWVNNFWYSVAVAGGHTVRLICYTCCTVYLKYCILIVGTSQLC